MKFTVPGILTASALALLPFFTTTHLFYGPVNAKFFLVIAFVDVLALIAAHRIFSTGINLPRKRWFLASLGITVLLQIVASVFGVFPERSLWSDIFWSSGVLFLSHLAIGAWLLSELLNERDWLLVRRSIALSAGVFAIFSIIGIAGLGVSGKFLWINLDQTGLTFGNETYAGTYLLLAFILGLLEVARIKEWERVHSLLLASLVLIAISPLMFNMGLLTGKTPLNDLFAHPAHLLGLARASSAALIALLMFYGGCVLAWRLVPKSANKLIAIWGSLLIAGLGLGIALLLTPGSVVQETYIQESTAARIIVWNSGMEAIAERPVLGWGPENFDYALVRHFDPQLFLDKNLSEIWFERAHNVFIDTLVGSGYLGGASFALLIALYVLVIYRARKRELIGDAETALLIALVPAHLLQLQTGFDTIGSYVLLAVVGGYVLWLERHTVTEVALSQFARKAVVSVLVVAALASALLMLTEYSRQAALLETFRARSVADQQRNMELSLSRVSSFESLRLSSASFLKGAQTLLAEGTTSDGQEKILGMAHRYEEQYVRFLAVQPDHYRAHLNYAYLLLVMTTLGEDRVSDAKFHIERAHELSPGHPLTYVLDALAELYRGDLAESRRLMDEAKNINPDIEFVAEARTYFERQWMAFPDITVLRLTNL